MRAAGARLLALLAITPLLVAASDPEGDVTGCLGGTGSGAPDLVEVNGEIVELGTSARWELTFAEPLAVPDDAGRPFRVDIAIRDPDVPVVTFAYYRNVNRLVRVDATIDHETEIYLLPERGTNVFNPPAVDGRTMTIQVPGRTLSDDEDLTGTSPGLDGLRWSVIVRDGRACDFLGDGRPTERLLAGPEGTVVTSPHAGTGSESRSILWVAAATAVTLLAIGGYAARRAR